MLICWIYSNAYTLPVCKYTIKMDKGTTQR